MTTTSGRHKMVEVECEFCGNKFLARKQRVDKGQGRYCSKKCFYSAPTPGHINNSKEKASLSYDKVQNRYTVYWFENGKRKNSTYARWAWEITYGDIPDGYVVVYKDGDKSNLNISNLMLVVQSEQISELGKSKKGVPKSEESKQKMSKSHKGKVLSDEHKKHIGDSNRKKWARGEFDKVHVGKYSKKYRDGSGCKYPKEFNESLKVAVRDRDNYQCQICGKRVSGKRSGHIHHINGMRNDNSMENLILVCVPCHTKIHSKGDLPPVLSTFREQLYWNK